MRGNDGRISCQGIFQANTGLQEGEPGDIEMIEEIEIGKRNSRT
jgi:hypothetical protein